MIWKVTHQIVGGYVLCSLLNSKAPPAGQTVDGRTFRKCGDFCVQSEHFAELKTVMSTVIFEERLKR